MAKYLFMEIGEQIGEHSAQLASGSDDGAIKIWDLGSFLDEFGDGSATSEEQKEIVRSVVRCHLIVVPS